MGVDLMKLAMHHGGALSGNAYKVLMRMSWTALDKPKDGHPARRYFAGWEPLALALGWDVPNKPTPAEGAEDPASAAAVNARRKKLQSYVSAATKELTDAGFVEVFEPGRRAGYGRQQEYRILTGLAPQKAGGNSTPESGVHRTPESGGQQHPRKQVRSTPESGVPRKEEDQPQDLEQDAGSSPPVPLARVCAACGHDRFTADDECLNCHTSRAVA